MNTQPMYRFVLFVALSATMHLPAQVRDTSLVREVYFSNYQEVTRFSVFAEHQAIADHVEITLHMDMPASVSNPTDIETHRVKVMSEFKRKLAHFKVPESIMIGSDPTTSISPNSNLSSVNQANPSQQIGGPSQYILLVKGEEQRLLISKVLHQMKGKLSITRIVFTLSNPMAVEEALFTKASEMLKKKLEQYEQLFGTPLKIVSMQESGDSPLQVHKSYSPRSYGQAQDILASYPRLHFTRSMQVSISPQ
jgi:hypothetical protein